MKKMTALGAKPHTAFRIALFWLLCGPLSLFSQKQITLDDCFTQFKFYPQGAGSFQYRNDGVHYCKADEDGNLHIHDLRDPKLDSLLTLAIAADSVKDYDRFEFSDDETKVLLRVGTEPVYRHSVLAHYFVYDFQTKKTEPLSTEGKQQFAAFSPDGQRVAFIFKNNLYIKNLEKNRTTQVTRDGALNRVINGLPDWVYEEEFSPVDGDGMVATRWSPDGSKLAFIRFDESGVPQIPLSWYEGDVYPRRSSFKYPKVGEKNSVVSVHLYDADGGSMVGKVMGLEADDYAPRIHFTEDNQLVVTRLNRTQDTLELLIALPERAIYDPADKTTWLPTRLLLRETDAAYVDVESDKKLVFLKDKKHFVWMSEQSGYNHLYLYDMNGQLVRPLTHGRADVTAFYGVDEINQKFFYQVALPTPLDRTLRIGSLDPTVRDEQLTMRGGVNEATFSPTFDYCTLSWSDANTPPEVTLCDRKGKTLRTLTDNARVRKLRQDYQFVDKTFFKFKLENGTELNGWMLKPAVLDSTKKYPVLFDNYGGPGSQTVQNQYDGYLGSWHQMLVQKGYVIVSVDNRGTGARGRDFKKCTQLQLGKLETEDQIAAARYLRTLPWVDPGRIGIWGWSFGGYLSTSCILKGNDVFKMAMAVAPVTNWKWYDSAYTERYMHTTKDNSKGYEDNSPVNFAERLRGGNYLICHGMADDNVHWQQTVEMINALIKANKQFETYYYPNRNHGIYGDHATQHLFTKLTNFVLTKL